MKFVEGEVVRMPLIVGSRKVVVGFRKDGPRLWLDFPYNKELIAEVKTLESAKYHGFDDPPIKRWTIADSQRNHFQLSYLAGMNPYVNYDKPLVEYTSPTRTPYSHQVEIVRCTLTYRRVIIAAEMGTGKTLSMIETVEHLGLTKPTEVWWISPKAALNSTRLELSKWKAKFQPTLLTYESLKKTLEEWKDNLAPPPMVIFDECSRLKNPTSQRSQAARYLADQMRYRWSENCWIVEMSGSPAPKNPGDWWHLCEVACPGFIKESSHSKFIDRLAVVEANESLGGGFYKRILAWKDTDSRCQQCGQLKDHTDHTADEFERINNPIAHDFVPGVNEVAYLYKRMKGLVHVFLKKDCLDLPEKRFEQVVLKPTLEMINALKMLNSTSKGAAEKLVHARELSDGFQYREVKDGVIDCVACNTTGKIDDDPCMSCGGRGCVDRVTRIYDSFPTPKEEALIDELEMHEDVGRLVVYAAFTASIDRVVDICRRHQWSVIKVDGRGWQYFGDSPLTELQMLEAFQKQSIDPPQRIVFVGHPASAGMGLTLTASPTIVYWSNDFNFESRIQSMDRIHRPGMDLNRGATIKDFICLPTDRLIIKNLDQKRDLQSLTLGDLENCINDTSISLDSLRQ